MYGKDRSVLEKLSATFGRTAALVSQNSQRRTGRGGNRFSNVYHPPTNGRTDTVRLLVGEYTLRLADEQANVIEVPNAFWSYEEHFDGRTQKSCVCSGGPLHKIPGRRDPCAPCDEFWEEIRNTKRGDARRWSKRTMFAFNVFVYGQFAEVDQIDRRTGRARVDNHGKPFKEWARCDDLRPAQYAGATIKEGHLMQWPMGTEHYHTLLAFNAKIEQACKSCGTKSVKKKGQPSKPAIYAAGYLCAHCQEEVIDLDRTELDAAAIQQLVSRPMKCPHCKELTEPFEALGCHHCSEPKRASIFDVDLEVQRVSANDGSKRTQLVISGFSDPYALEGEALAASERLYDLPSIYAPLPYEKQFEYFGITDDNRASQHEKEGEEEEESPAPPPARTPPRRPALPAAPAPAPKISKRPYPGTR